MKHADERVALQAVEFWSTVCEEEVDLAIEAQEVKHIVNIHRPIRLTLIPGCGLR